MSKTASPGRTSTSRVWRGATRTARSMPRARPAMACACSTAISPPITKGERNGAGDHAARRLLPADPRPDRTGAPRARDAHPCERRPPARGRRLGDAAAGDRRGALDAEPGELPAARPRGLARRGDRADPDFGHRSEEHTSELQSLMRISYAVFCLTKKTK